MVLVVNFKLEVLVGIYSYFLMLKSVEKLALILLKIKFVLSLPCCQGFQIAKNLN